jgi:hypothetical protein
MAFVVEWRGGLAVATCVSHERPEMVEVPSVTRTSQSAGSSWWAVGSSGPRSPKWCQDKPPMVDQSKNIPLASRVEHVAKPQLEYQKWHG